MIGYCYRLVGSAYTEKTEKMETKKSAVPEHKVVMTMVLPPYEPASEEELQRRRELFDHAMAFRERIGPIGITAAELIREVRDDADEDY